MRLFSYIVICDDLILELMFEYKELRLTVHF